MGSITKFNLQHSFDSHFDAIYATLLDFKKFGEVHPYITKVDLIQNNYPYFIEYAIFEEIYLFGFIKNYPRYHVKVFEVEKNKHIRYTSTVKKSIFLTIDITFKTNKNGSLVVTEAFEIESNKLMGLIFGDILKKAHLKFFENLKKILHNSIEELHLNQ